MGFMSDVPMSPINHPSHLCGTLCFQRYPVDLPRLGSNNHEGITHYYLLLQRLRNVWTFALTVRFEDPMLPHFTILVFLFEPSLNQITGWGISARVGEEASMVISHASFNFHDILVYTCISGATMAVSDRNTNC